MVKSTVSAILALMSSAAHGAEFKLLEPRDVFIDVYKNETVHDPYLYPIDRTLGYGSTFNVDTNVVRYGKFSIFWLNKLHFDQSNANGHIKHAGWQYEVGMPLWIDRGVSRIELFKQHHSRHLLEETRSIHFPVYDRFGVRLRILP